MGKGTEKTPHYYKLGQARSRNQFVVMVDEGWRVTIVCSGMYEWAADWLVSELQGKPYAPGTER